MMACLYALYQVFGGRLSDSLETTTRTGGFVVGIATGLVSTLMHAGGVVMMLYLAPLRLAGRTFVATAFLIGAVLTFVKAVPYLGLGLIDEASLAISFLMLPALAVGALLGMLLNHRMPKVWFNRLILIIVLVVGVRLLLT